MKFKPRKIHLTRGIYHTITESESFAQFVYTSLQRHIQGHWGECCSEDVRANETALKQSGRLFSVYQGEEKIWIITEWVDQLRRYCIQMNTKRSHTDSQLTNRDINIECL